MSDNTKISTCDFADELISYLYDEMNVADKLRFETHLKNCSGCSEEVSGLSLARSSILEWREVEFLPLENPAIKIPYPEKQSQTNSSSWLVAIRDFFTLSPAWMTASTAFAALVICAALFAVVFSSLRNDSGDVAGKQTNNNNIRIISSPTDGNLNLNQNSNSNANQNKPKPVNSPQSPTSDSIERGSVTATEPTKIVSKPNPLRQPPLPVKTIQKSPNRIPAKQSTVKSTNQKAPSFLDEEDEDNSLTLTDLLEQIGSKEKDD